MTPLPSRRVWMTNVLTGITREHCRYYVNRSLVSLPRAPLGQHAYSLVHRKLAIRKLYKVLARKNATANLFSKKQFR